MAFTGEGVFDVNLSFAATRMLVASRLKAVQRLLLQSANQTLHQFLSPQVSPCLLAELFCWAFEGGVENPKASNCLTIYSQEIGLIARAHLPRPGPRTLAVFVADFALWKKFPPHSRQILTGAINCPWELSLPHLHSFSVKQRSIGRN